MALVTGGGRGIGKRIALGLAGAGAEVAVLGRTAAELESTKAQIRSLGRRGLALVADTRSEADIIKAVESCADGLGAPHILVNAAGIQGPIGRFDSLSMEEWARTLQVNLVGVAYATHAALRYMIPERRGKILNISGGGAAGARPFFSAYAVSKAAVVRFTETLADEVREYGIQVNVIGPGATKTRMTEEVLAAGARAGEKGRAEAEEVWRTGGTPAEKQVALAVFLASSESDHVTGRFLHVNDPWPDFRNSRDLPDDLYTLRRVEPVRVPA
ncbi:MAG: SDR family oxidoreductase [Candidatus Eisenbacteria bacterium]